MQDRRTSKRVFQINVQDASALIAAQQTDQDLGVGTGNSGSASDVDPGLQLLLRRIGDVLAVLDACVKPADRVVVAGPGSHVRGGHLLLVLVALGLELLLEHVGFLPSFRKLVPDTEVAACVDGVSEEHTPVRQRVAHEAERYDRDQRK